jgi:hypothetical protein
MANNLFTPYLSRGSKVRAYMDLNLEDYRKFKALEKGQAVKVKDQLSGEEFLVKQASCGITNCYCAAEIVSPIRW